MTESYGIDMPEFQLLPDRREYLRKHGTLIESINEAGKKVYSKPLQPSTIVDDDGTIIYLGEDEVVRRERGMCVIEQTPQWILRAIMQNAKGNYAARGISVWPETVWNVQYGIRQVFNMLKVDDDAMPLKLRKMLLNDAGPLISRFLIRENPEYGETHFIGIRRRLIKGDEKEIDADKNQMELDIPSEKVVAVARCLDDYLFPELRGLTTDAVTAPGA